MSRTTDIAGAQESASLLLERASQGIAVLTLNRPEARNALSLDLIGELNRRVVELSTDSTVAAIVLAANGPAFCAGHDLKEMTARRGDADGGRAFFARTMSSCSAMMQSIVACPKPVIAAVEGMATAAGCQLVATCDLAVAAQAATFATPGVNIGLFCSTPMVALSRALPRKRAMEMLLLGDSLPAGRAAEFGLINRVVEKGMARSAALEMASVIAAKSKVTVAIGKEAFYRQIEMPLASAYDYATSVMVENMMQADAGEGICAFLEKRPPNWKDA